MALALSGCFGSSGGDPAPRAKQVAASYGGRLSAQDVERELGNGFRRGLYRLAVMTQHSDDATDLGQDLPSGLLERVRCHGDRCTVRWETVGGRPRSTDYAVHEVGGGCFSAGADPPLPQRYDSTIHSYAENPLNVIVGAGHGC